MWTVPCCRVTLTTDYSHVNGLKMQKDHNATQFDAEDGGQSLKRTDVSAQSLDYSTLVAPLLAAIAAAAAVARLNPSPAVAPLLIGVIFAIMGLGILFLSRYKRMTGIVSGALAGLSSSLALHLDGAEGYLLGIIAIVYGAAIAVVLRMNGMPTAAALLAPYPDPAHGLAQEGGRSAGINAAGIITSTSARRDEMAWQTPTEPIGRPVSRDDDETAKQVAPTTLQFMEDVIQEIRLPLNTILGFAEILQSSAARDLTENERNTYPQMLLDCSRQLSGFVTDVADMLRIDANHFHLVEQEVDAAELTEIAMKSCRAAAEEADSTVIVNVIENVELRCDAARIRRVLVTLVTHAIRASRPGTAIAVSFSPVSDGSLDISVIDTSSVQSQETIERAFEPSLHAGGKDRLGLAIARKIARLHGGDVTVSPEPGGGMASHLILPPDRVCWSSATAKEAA